jgi:DMSO/TMAO reductase YedYZ molybdopterin-dependent catalytic subunit
VDDALNGQALLAYAMNGEPLPVEHGYPLRMIVPSWYAVASVKWLTNIELVSKPFDGYFQTDQYMFEIERDGKLVREPVSYQRVRALVTEPNGLEDIPAGDLAIRGVAWSGLAPTGSVEVSIGDGPWQPARLVGEQRRHCWQWWELLANVETAGETTIRARATDLAGRVQPDAPEWNRLGYCGNAVQVLRISVR